MHSLKSQGKFFLSFPFFTYFGHLKIRDEILKKFSGLLHFTILSFLQHINNYLGLNNSYTYTQYLNNYLGQLSTYAISK